MKPTIAAATLVLLLASELAADPLALVSSRSIDLGPGDTASIAVGDFDGDRTNDALVHAEEATRLLTPGGENPPTIDEIEDPTVVRAGDRYELEITGVSRATPRGSS